MKITRILGKMQIDNSCIIKIWEYSQQHQPQDVAT